MGNNSGKTVRILYTNYKNETAFRNISYPKESGLVPRNGIPNRSGCSKHTILKRTRYAISL